MIRVGVVAFGLQLATTVTARVCGADWATAACNVPTQHFHTANVTDGLVSAEACRR